MKFLKHLFALGLFLCPAISPAQTLLIGPQAYGARILPSSGGTTLYGENDSRADYVIGQWGNPVSDLLGFSGGVATSPNITVTLSTDGSGNIWTDLASNGSNLPCYPAAHAELDAFVGPIGGNYPLYPQAVLGTANLGSVSHLYMAVTAEPVGFSTQSNACATALSGMFVALVFNNPTAHQTLFYQLRLQSYPTQAGAGFFSNTNPYGYRDVLKKYGGIYPLGIPVGSATSLNLDVLPRLTTIISGATNGLDTNVAHWNTGGAYMGHNLFGDISAETEWCCFSVTVP